MLAEIGQAHVEPPRRRPLTVPPVGNGFSGG
jgi:hypothetical protein